MFVDIMNGMRNIIWAFMSGPLGISNAQLGLVATAYSMINALVQPFFGMVADRGKARWIMALGVLWMGTLYILAITISGWVGMGLLVLASLGSGAFHPAGTMSALMAGMNVKEGRESTAASTFFLFGQIGYFIGPILAGIFLERFGLAALVIIVGLAIPSGLFTGKEFTIQPKPGEETETAPANGFNRLNGATGIILLLMIVAGCQSWAQQNVLVYYPKLLNDLGYSASLYGLMAALFSGGIGLGNYFGGPLADRFGKVNVIWVSLALGALPMGYLALGHVSSGLYFMVLLAGILTGGAFSPFVVLAQSVMPGKKGLSSGLMLGFIFTSGALGTFLSGFLADRFGLQQIFWMNVPLLLVAALAGAFLSRLPQLVGSQAELS